MDEFKEFENDIETAKTRHFEVRSFIIHTSVHVVTTLAVDFRGHARTFPRGYG